MVALRYTCFANRKHRDIKYVRIALKDIHIHGMYSKAIGALVANRLDD